MVVSDRKALCRSSSRIISKQIANVINQSDLSRAEVAETLGITVNALRLKMKGEHPFTTAEAIVLAIKLNCTLDDLIGPAIEQIEA